MSRNRYDPGKKDTFHTVLLFPVLMIVLWLVFSYVIGIARVDGVSMTGTLTNGEFLLMDRMQKNVSRGEIVDILLPSGDYYVKRVVAVAGDTVRIKDGILYINDEPEQGYSFLGETKPESGSVTYPYTVPENCVFAVGDNREESVDSRAFGAVSLSGIKGVIKYRFGWLYISSVE